MQKLTSRLRTPVRIGRRKLLAGLVSSVIPLEQIHASPSTASDAAQRVVASADEIRNPGVPFRMVNTIVEYRSDEAQRQVTLEVFAKTIGSSGEFATLVRYLEPTSEVGKMFLKNGNDMWFYDQNSKASIRISPQQRLIGQASIGDVICANYIRDYQAESIAEETIYDADRRSIKCWRISLVAKRIDSTYASIDYWVDASNSNPVKAHYFSDSGRKLKIIFYRDFKPVLGKKRASSAIIIDAVNTNLATIMCFSDAEEKSIPDYWFQRDFLPHFSDV